MADNFNKYYASDQKLEDIYSGFTLVAIIIACIGLFSLSAYIIERKIRDFGIYKISGASNIAIFKSRIRRFLILIFISMVLAYPVGFLMMETWLKHYPYHIQIVPISFLLPFIVSITAAILAVSSDIYHNISGSGYNTTDSEKPEACFKSNPFREAVMPECIIIYGVRCDF